MLIKATGARVGVVSEQAGREAAERGHQMSGLRHGLR